MKYNLSSVNKAEIAEWIDAHRKAIILCASFEDAAFIISRDLFGFKQRESFVIDIITKLLHGSSCSCKTIKPRFLSGQNVPTKYDLGRNWNAL